MYKIFWIYSQYAFSLLQKEPDTLRKNERSSYGILVMIPSYELDRLVSHWSTIEYYVGVQGRVKLPKLQCGIRQCTTNWPYWL